MDFVEGVGKVLVDAAVGGMSAIALVLVYLVSVQTEEKIICGCAQQKITAYGLRMVAVIGAYSIILACARVSYCYTEQNISDAVLFVGSSLVILGIARAKLMKKRADVDIK
jgi:hypothetical protein